MKEIHQFIDHTLLKPTATPDDIIQLCNEAIQYNFFSVCVNSSFVPLARKALENSDVSVCSVVGFPLGAMSTASKAFEAKTAIENGADEIDMVINIGLLKGEDFEAVTADIMAVKKAIGTKVLKVILEVSSLSKDEIKKACEICITAKADFVKTSTGFGSGGATVEAITIMKNTVKNRAKLKASGGIRDFETAKIFMDLGVHRLGVSSGIAIVEGRESNSEY